MQFYFPAIRVCVVTSLTIILMTSDVIQAKEKNEEAKILEEPTETASTNATPTSSGEEVISSVDGVTEKPSTPDSKEENIGLLSSVAFSTDIIKSTTAAMAAVNTVVQVTVKQANQKLESSSTMVRINSNMASNSNFTFSPETNTTAQVTIKQTDLVSTPVMIEVTAFATNAVKTSSVITSASDSAAQIDLKKTDQLVSSAGMTKAAAFSTKAVINTSSVVVSATTDEPIQITLKQTDLVLTAGISKATASITKLINTNSAVEYFKQTKPLATTLMLPKVVTPTSLPMTPKVTKHLKTSKVISAAASSLRQFTASITMKIPPEVDYSSQSSEGEKLWWLYVCIPVILLAALLVTGGVYAVKKRYARKNKELPEERHRLNEDETRL